MSFLHHLRQPEYVHVLLNPVPVYGMAMAAFGLAAGMVARSRAARVIGFLMILIVTGTTWAAVHYGERGYDRVYAMSGNDAQQWLTVHKRRGEAAEALFGTCAVVALLGLLMESKRPQFATGVAAVALTVSLLACADAAWVSQAGGQVRHSEFRDGPP